MRTTSIGSDNGQRLINQAPTLPKHIATKEYVDQSSSQIVEALLNDALLAFQSGINAQLADLQTALVPPTAVPLGAGEPADLAVGDYFVLTANGNQTITLTNVEALDGRPRVIVFDIRNTSTLNLTWNVPGLTFSRGAPVGLTPNGRDFIVLVTSDGGASWTLVLAAPDVRAV